MILSCGEVCFVEKHFNPSNTVNGQVKIDGQVVANRNIPFSYTFKTKRKRVRIRPPEWEVNYPEGVVVDVTGNPNISIDFGLSNKLFAGQNQQMYMFQKVLENCLV